MRKNQEYVLEYECYDRILDRDISMSVRYTGDCHWYVENEDMPDEVINRHAQEITERVAEELEQARQGAIDRYNDLKLLAWKEGER